MNDEKKLEVIIIGDQLRSFSGKSRLLEALKGMDIEVVDESFEERLSYDKVWIDECHITNGAWDGLRMLNPEVGYAIGSHSQYGTNPNAANPIKRVSVGKSKGEKRNKKLLRAQRGW